MVPEARDSLAIQCQSSLYLQCKRRYKRARVSIGTGPFPVWEHAMFGYLLNKYHLTDSLKLRTNDRVREISQCVERGCRLLNWGVSTDTWFLHGKTYLFCRSCLQTRQMNQLERMMVQTTRFRPRKCLLGVWNWYKLHFWGSNTRKVLYFPPDAKFPKSQPNQFCLINLKSKRLTQN